MSKKIDKTAKPKILMPYPIYIALGAYSKTTMLFPDGTRTPIVVVFTVRSSALAPLIDTCQPGNRFCCKTKMDPFTVFTDKPILLGRYCTISALPRMVSKVAIGLFCSYALSSRYIKAESYRLCAVWIFSWLEGKMELLK